MARDLTSVGQKKLAAAALVIAVAASILMVWFIGRPMLTLARSPEQFRAWVRVRGFGGKLLFMGMVLLQTLIALLPGEPFEIAAGYAFGAVEGTALCLIASGVGSMLVFFLVRCCGVRLAEVFFSREKLSKLTFLKSTPKRTLLFLLIFILPGTPKDLLSYFAGLTDISPGAFALICTLGRLPSVVTSTVGGDALGTQNYGYAIVMFLVTFAISAAGLLLYNQICKKHRK